MVESCGKSASGDHGGAAGRSEGEAAFGGIEVGTLMEGEGELVPERSRGSVVQQDTKVVFLSGAEDFGALSGREAWPAIASRAL